MKVDDGWCRRIPPFLNVKFIVTIIWYIIEKTDIKQLEGKHSIIMCGSIMQFYPHPLKQNVATIEPTI